LIVISKLALAAMMLLAMLLPAVADDKLGISGKVYYRERLLLPAGSVLTVSLIDIDKPVQPIVSVEAVTADRGRSPLEFTLKVADGVLRAGQNYGLTAEIVTSGDRLWFTSALPVALDLAQLDMPVEILVVGTGQKPLPEAEIARFYDKLLEIIELAGTELVDGQYPTLQLSPDLRASGTSGCNNWFAQATVDGQSIGFSPAAATRMACPGKGVSEQESAFFAALEKVAGWAMRGQLIQLFDTAGAEIILLAPLPDV
jgi:putative lipoprotein